MSQTHDLTMERKFAAPPRTVYDAPPGLEAFTEDRVLSAVEPPHRLAYSVTALFPGQLGFSTEVDLIFSPDGTGTRLALTQRGFPDAASRDDFADGWSGVWDMLAPGEHDAGSAG